LHGSREEWRRRHRREGSSVVHERHEKKCGWLLLHGCMQLKKELMEDEGAVKREIKGHV